MGQPRPGGKPDSAPDTPRRRAPRKAPALPETPVLLYSGAVHGSLKESALAVIASDRGRLAPAGLRSEREEDTPPERAMAKAVRAVLRDALAPTGAGVGGFALGMAEVATVLWTRFLAFDAADPAWPDRDRFVLDAEEGEALLAALLHLTGQTAPPRLTGPMEGEASAGAAGQGLALAVGLAMAERSLAGRFGRSLVDHRTWVIASAGALASGTSHEAAAVAGALRLGKLTVLAEDAEPASDNPGDPIGSDDVLKRFSAYSWATKRIDARDPHQIAAALAYAVRSARPTLVLCRIERGEGEAAGPFTEPSQDGFAVSPEVARAWAEAGRRGARARLAWRRRHHKSPQRDEFDRTVSGRLPEGWRAALDACKAKASSERPMISTREASRQTLEALAAALPDLIGGAADGAGTGVSSPKAMVPIAGANRFGRHVAWGARMTAMAAATAGLALHGGVIPYIETSLEVGDAVRPGLRLAAATRRRAIHLLHQRRPGAPTASTALRPADALAALRAVPNLFVFRPADAVEVAEAWALALAREDGPSVVVLGEEVLPTLRAAHTAENLSARGGYVLAEAEGPRVATLIATGAEVAIALAARELLAARGIGVAVVSLPCFEVFAVQDETWRALVLGGALRVGIEAGTAQGWERWLGLSGLFLGPETVPTAVDGAQERGSGLTAEGVAQAVLRRLS